VINMPKKDKKKKEEEKEKKEEEEKQEPLKVKEEEEIIVLEERKVRSSNIEDDLGNQLTKSQKTELTNGGNCSLHKHDDIYLNKSNTTAYTPTADYHPATKKYVDDKANGIAVVYTDVDVTNTALETAILDETIPGGTLGTSNAIKARLYLWIYREAANTFELRVYYGNSYIGVGSISPPANTDLYGYLDILLVAAGATNSQELSFLGIFPKIYSGYTEIAGEGIFYVVNGSSVSISEDSTVDKNLKVTINWDSAQTTDHVKLIHAVIEKIKV